MQQCFTKHLHVGMQEWNKTEIKKEAEKRKYVKNHNCQVKRCLAVVTLARVYISLGLATPQSSGWINEPNHTLVINPMSQGTYDRLFSHNTNSIGYTTQKAILYFKMAQTE